MGVKFFNTSLLNCINPEIEKVLRKIQNVFRRKPLTTTWMLKIHRILKWVRAKIWKRHFYLEISSRHLTPNTEGRWRKFLAYGLPKETVTAIMMLYKNTEWKITLSHCYWCSSRGYCSPISVHNLPRRFTSNVDRSNERKYLTTNYTKADDNPQKLLWTWITYMIYHFLLPKPNPCYMFWSMQLVEFASMRMQTKRTCDLIKKGISLLQTIVLWN